MRKNANVKSETVDAMLELMNKVIAEKQFEVRYQTREARKLASKQRLAREILHELMKRRSEYLRLKKEATK